MLFEEGSVLEQDCVVVGPPAGKLREEKCHAAEDQTVAEMSFALDEVQSEKQKLAAGADKIVMDTGALHLGAGSRFVLVEDAETAVADTVALAGSVEIADVVVLRMGPVELADTAAPAGLAVVGDNDGLGTADYADTVA